MKTEVVCPNCKGTKEQVYHKAFISFVDKCNFCNGKGTMDGFQSTFVRKLKTSSVTGWKPKSGYVQQNDPRYLEAAE